MAFYTFYMRKQCDALFDTAPLGTPDSARHTMATARATAGAPARATTARWIATRSRATRATRGTRGRARATPNDGEAHAAYLRDVAATRAPAELAALARVLDALGCETIAPNARRGIHPLVMPLARTREGGVIGLMVTEDDGEATPVVEVRDGAHATMLAKSARDYVHRAIVEEEAMSDEQTTTVAAAAGAVGVSLHAHGAFKTSGKEFDVYVTTQIGKFPSSMEGLVRRHLKRNDEQSALITCDLYKATFGDWGAPHVFISDLYSKLGRDEEARDAARQALQTPWSTIGGRDAITRMIDVAGWSGKTVAEIKEVLESRRGPSAAAFDGPKSEKQLAREEGELLLDQIAAGEIESSTVNQRLAECYMNAGKPALAKFIMCGAGMPAL